METTAKKKSNKKKTEHKILKWCKNGSAQDPIKIIIRLLNLFASFILYGHQKEK